MKALGLMLLGGVMMALGIAKMAYWEWFSLVLVIAGVVVGIMGLIANHRDHTSRR